MISTAILTKSFGQQEGGENTTHIVVNNVPPQFVSKALWCHHFLLCANFPGFRHKLDTKQTYKKEKKQNVSHIKGPEESKMLMLAKRAAAPPVKSTHFQERTTLCPSFIKQPFAHHWTVCVSSFTSFKISLINILVMAKWQVQLTFLNFYSIIFKALFAIIGGIQIIIIKFNISHIVLLYSSVGSV